MITGRQMKAVLGFTTASVIMIGCANLTDQPRRYDSPGHGNYLARDMWDMASSIRNLVLLSIDTNVVDSERHIRVLKDLDALDRTARIVKDGKEIYNYSVANPYLGSFIHDVSMAREFALQSPPDYSPATKLINSCLLCHAEI